MTDALPDPARRDPLRVLVTSHVHPRLTRGGAEIAAHRMAEGLRDAGARVSFLAGSAGRVPMPLGVPLAQPFGADDYVLDDSAYDHFRLLNRSPALPDALRDLLRRTRPDVVHLHHYANIGLEFLLHVRTVLPDAAILLTLHEFGAICHHLGQMVKRPSLALCRRASPIECAGCFPEIGPDEFFLRERVIRRFLGLVDHFVSPSAFLAGRYAEWGIPRNRIAVIENGQVIPPDPPLLPSARTGLVLGFFGQLSKLKGVEVLLDAAALLRRAALPRPVRIEVHGDGSMQPKEMRDGVERRLREARGIVSFLGPYANEDAARLMAGCHAVVVPSLWWENSPMVIQEALATRRPVICADIGGMAEKVRPGVDGFHFRAGSAASLADLIATLAAEPERLTVLQRGLANPPDRAHFAQETLALYYRVLAARHAALP